MKKYIATPQDDILYMSNMYGEDLVPEPMPFSFYFSYKSNSRHGIRVKVMFNPSRLIGSQVGTLKLCDDWKFIPGANDKHASSKDIKKMKKFFRDNIVLFAAVWDGQVEDGKVQRFLDGRSSFQKLLENFEFYDRYRKELEDVKTVKQLEQFCRKNYLVNFYGN